MKEQNWPLSFEPFWTPFDLSDQQVDRPVDVVGLDVANNGVEESAALLVVCWPQSSPLLHWEHKHQSIRESAEIFF